MKKEIVPALIWAGLMLAVALAAKYAQHQGYLEQDTAQRLVFALIGLWIVWYGNRMPKAVVPNACALKAKRFAGWAMVLSGLTYAGLWAFAPFSVAVTGGTVAVLAGIAATLAYCLKLRGGAAA